MSYIYILYESTFTSNYFYVGKTNNPTQRIREHFRTIEFYGNTPKNNWIRKYNKTIAMKILCEVPQYLTWQEAEKQWISFLKWCNVNY